ncbi:MAG TPA: aspartyl protease family protein [Rhizomicrobium sp.]|nr:aspartyl protease family protein [Rhizomicrobium sp.]
MKKLTFWFVSSAAALTLAFTGAGRPATASPGDALLAAGDFAAADRAYDAAVKAWPSDISAEVGLARVRLYENRNDEAIALARKALAAQPDNALAKQILGSAQQRQSDFAADRYRSSGAPPETSIPFVVTDPLPVVQVTVAGQHANFLIDTGGPDIVVSAGLARALGLQVQSGGEGVFAGGLRAQVQRTIVPELEIGQVKIANVPAGVMPQMLPIPGAKVDGVIGTGLLMHFLPTLDYCQGRLVLRPRTASAEFQRTVAAEGANSAPMWLVGDHFLFARAHLQHGSEGLFAIDTGLAGAGLAATKPALDEAGVAIDPNAAKAGMGGGGAVSFIPFQADATLGSLTVQNVPGSYSPGGDPFGMFPFKVSGALSHMFFRKTRLSLDFDAMRLVTESCAAKS